MDAILTNLIKNVNIIERIDAYLESEINGGVY